MSGAFLILIGLLLCLTGARSVRLAVATAGFGACWLVADAFGAAASTALVIGVSGAVLVLLLSLVMARLMFFFVGGVAGAVVGAELFAVLDTGDASVLLALVFIPAVALGSAFLAHRWRARFVTWVTAFAGAALALAGLGRLVPDQLTALNAPETSERQVVVGLAWFALGLAGRAVQRRTAPGGDATAG